MGKEAKFGLALIAVLLVTFAVVLVSQVRESGDEKPPVASKEKDKAKGKETADTKKKDSSLLANLSSPPKKATTDKRAVVTKKPAWAGTGGGSSSPWNVASDDDKTTVKSADPPSSSYIMPEPDDQYTQYPEPSPYPDYRQGHDTASTQQPTGTGAHGAAVASDPYPHRSGLGGTASSTVNVLRPPSPSPSPSSGIATAGRPSVNSYGNRYSGSPYPSGGSTRLASPPRHHGSSYSLPAAPKSGPAYSVSTTPISTHADSSPLSENGQYKVRPNDSYWRISETLYQTGAYFRALAEHNRTLVPREDQLAVGDVISTPTVEELEKAYPDLCPKPSRREAVRNLAQAVSMRTSSYGNGPTYVVEEGDTLFDIARYELGKAARWAEIHELNRDILGEDYDYLVPGTRLTMPGNAPADTITSRPGTGATFHR